MRYILIFAIATVVTFLITPTIRYFSLKLLIVDRRSNRKLHNRIVTRFGGLAIYIGFLFAMVYVFTSSFKLGLQQQDFSNYIAIIMTSSLILILGIFDDAKGANALIKFSIQILAALILIQSGFMVKIISNPFGPPIELGVFSIPVTILWLVGITNAVNLIDGLDGLAAGIVFIVTFSMFWMFFLTGQIMPAFFAIALAGACLGFLRYNYPPAKVFMGDTGSLFLGFSIAALSILTNYKGNTAISLLVPAIIGLGIPIIDTSFAFFRRIAIKKVNPFHADKEHIHHLLLKLNLSEKKVVFILWTITAFLSTVACWIYLNNK